jgi:hypothetical protein
MVVQWHYDRFFSRHFDVPCQPSVADWPGSAVPGYDVTQHNNIYSVLRYAAHGYSLCQASESHLKILRARKVTCSKNYTADTEISTAT